MEHFKSKTKNRILARMSCSENNISSWCPYHIQSRGLLALILSKIRNELVSSLYCQNKVTFLALIETVSESSGLGNCVVFFQSVTHAYL